MSKSWLLQALVFGSLAGCTSSWNESGPPPFTAAETDRALAPVTQLKPRCYQGSVSQRERRSVKLEFILYVDERGAVRSDPVAGDLRDPELTECVRRGLDALSFPAKTKRDQIHLNLELAE